MLDFPLEYALVVFPDNKFSGEIVPELLDLADRGIVRYVDIIFIRKDADGSTRTIELNELDPDLYQYFVPIGKQIQSLYTEDDVTWAANQLPKNSSAALFLWENIWMEKIRGAMMNSGAILADRGQIPDEVVEAVRKEMAAEANSQK
jgi:hypothetical protein